MTCAIDGIKSELLYTHKMGRIEAFLNPDGKSLEASWFEAPSYQPPDNAGRVTLAFSNDGYTFSSQ